MSKLGYRTPFWSKVSKSEHGCWEWVGGRNSNGYGLYRDEQDKYWYAHRLSWTITNGEIPTDKFVLHHCDNPPCVRPEHLYLGTAKENGRDMKIRGRARPGGQHKFSENEVAKLKTMYATGLHSHRSLAAMYEVDHRTIGRIVRGETYVPRKPPVNKPGKAFVPKHPKRSKKMELNEKDPRQTIPSL